MPVMDGVTASKIIGDMMREKKTTETKIVAVTAAEDNPEVRAQLQSAGIIDMVQKPLTRSIFSKLAQSCQIIT